MISIRNIMTESVITIDENSKISEASKLMVNRDVSSLLVTKNKKPIAIITENDIIKEVISKNKNLGMVRVKDVMNKKFRIINPNTKYNEVVRDLREKKIKRFPVVDADNNLIGLVTESDIIQATRDFTRMHQIVQEVILTVFGLVTAFFLFFFSPLGISLFRRG